MTDDDAQRIYSAAFEALRSEWREDTRERRRRRTSELIVPAEPPERIPRNFRELGNLLSRHMGLSVLVETALPPLEPLL